MATLIIIAGLIWLVYQLGKASERVKSDKSEAERMIENLRERIDCGESGFKSFSDAYDGLVLPGVNPEWSPGLRREFEELLLIEARQEKKLIDLARAQEKAQELIQAVRNGSTRFDSVEEMRKAIGLARLHGKYKDFSDTYMNQLMHLLKLAADQESK